MAEDLHKARINLNIWYLIFNIAAIFTVYYIPDSLIYAYINNNELYVLYTFHGIHIVSFFSYYITSWSDPGYVEYLQSAPPQNILSQNDIDWNQRHLFCEQCQFIKPLHSKHCKVCNRCVALFDHHCGWINNCVGYSNHKIYFLYVITQFIVCGFLLNISTQSIFLDQTQHAPVSIFDLYRYTPLYVVYFCYKSMYGILYELFIAHVFDGYEYQLTWTDIAKFGLFIGMTVAVVMSAMLGLWNSYLIVTNQRTYSLIIEQRDKDHPSEKESNQTADSSYKHLFCNIRAYLCGQIAEKYTKATCPSTIRSCR